MSGGVARASEDDCDAFVFLSQEFQQEVSDWALRLLENLVMKYRLMYPL